MSKKNLTRGEVIELIVGHVNGASDAELQRIFDKVFVGQELNRVPTQYAFQVNDKPPKVDRFVPHQSKFKRW